MYGFSQAVLAVSHSAMYSFHEKNIQLLTRLSLVRFSQKYPIMQYSNKKSKVYLTKIFSSHHYPQLFRIRISAIFSRMGLLSENTLYDQATFS